MNSIELVKKEINLMMSMDQQARKEKNPDWNKINKIDEENQAKITRIVKKYGLIKISSFGQETSDNAWLLVQHATESSIKFMEYYLSLMEQNRNDINPNNYAKLKDRILMYKKKPQIYGTQLFRKKDSNVWLFYPIENIKEVDKLRKKVKLGSLKDYAKDIGEYLGKTIQMPEGYDQ